MEFGSAAWIGSIAGAASFAGVSSIVAGSAASSTFGGVVASFFLTSLLLPALLALRKSPVSLFVFASPSPSDFSFLTLPVRLPKMEPRFDLRAAVGVVAGASSLRASSLGVSSDVSFGASAGVSVASAGFSSIFGASAGVSVAGSSFAGTGGTISASFFSVVGLLSFEARLPKMEPRLVGFGAAFDVSAASAVGSVVSAVSVASAGLASSLGPSRVGTGAAAAVKCYQLLQLSGIHRDLLASSVASAEGSVAAAGAAASSFFSSAFSSFFPRRLPKMLPRLRERDRLLLLDFFFPSPSSLLLDPVRAGAADSVDLSSVLFLGADPSLATDAPAAAGAAGLP